MRFKSLLSQLGKPLNPREALSNRSSKWVARHFGVSRRTAQRWKAGSQQPSQRADRLRRVMDSADSGTRRKVAADQLRDAQVAHVGRVDVKYPGGRVGGKGKRNVGTVPLDDAARDKLRRAADAVERGDMEEAERLVSDAVLNTNGRNYGPLEVADWPPGFDLT